MPLPAPVGLVLLASSIVPPSATIQWPQVTGADHYDLYRSGLARDIGSKINVNPILQAPTLTFLDDGVNSTSPPPIGVQQFYRAVASDISGNISLPSLALPVIVQQITQVLDSTQQKIYTALIGDSTLNGLLGGDAVGRIRFHHMIPEQGNDEPFVVFWKLPQKENKKMRPFRQVTMGYQFEVFDKTHGSQVARQIKERIIKVIEPILQTGGLTDCSVHVFSALFLDAGVDLYDERVNLWSYSTKLELVAELHDV